MLTNLSLSAHFLNRRSLQAQLNAPKMPLPCDRFHHVLTMPHVRGNSRIRRQSGRGLFRVLEFLFGVLIRNRHRD